MSGVRLNSEKKIENKDFKVKIGTTNKLNPLVIYVEGRAFISPTEDKDSYTRDISEIKHALKVSISDHLHASDDFDNKYIVDFQVATNGIQVNKKSFLSFQFLMRQNQENIKRLIEVKEKSAPMILEIIQDLHDSIIDKGFVLSKTKTTKNAAD